MEENVTGSVMDEKHQKDIDKFKSSHMPKFKLESFEGPLDLLLHLIQKEKLDIYDIPIAEITKQYMRLISSQNLEKVDLDLVGEYLLMAATLTQIKSKMLIPRNENDKDGSDDDFGLDPRNELVTKLLEYQRFKDAAANLAASPKFNHDSFKPGYRPTKIDLSNDANDSIDANDIDIFTLIACFNEIISNLPEENPHEIIEDHTTILEKIHSIIDVLRCLDDEDARVPFSTLFSLTSRSEIIITFLSILELNRLKYIKISQPVREGELWVRKNFDNDDVDLDVLNAIEDTYSNQNFGEDEEEDKEELADENSNEITSEDMNKFAEEVKEEEPQNLNHKGNVDGESDSKPELN